MRFLMPHLSTNGAGPTLSVSIPPFEAIFWNSLHHSTSIDAADRCSYVGDSPQGLSYDHLCIFSRDDTGLKVISSNPSLDLT